MKVIITADDFGFTKGINEGIKDCARAGNVQAISVMTNMPFWRDIKEVHALYPDTSLGIHWTVTQGKPTLPIKDVRSLVDHSGRFWSKREFQIRFLFGLINKGELSVELQSQYQLLRSEVGEVDFWNTHQNVHLFNGVHHYFCKTASLLGIQGMRTNRPYEMIYHKPLLWEIIRDPLLYMKALLNYYWFISSVHYGFSVPDGIHAFSDLDLSQSLKAPTDDSCCEIFIHPAKSVEELNGRSTMISSRLKEWEFFSSPGRLDPVRIGNIGFVNFRELSSASNHSGNSNPRK